MKKLLAALVLSLLGACLPLVASAQTAAAPKPTCFLSAPGNAPNIGATVNLSWTSSNATGGTITTIGSVGTSGKQGVIPIYPSTTYVGTFTGPGGTGTCSITIGVSTNGGGTGNPGSGTFPTSGTTAGTGGLNTAPAGSNGSGLVACTNAYNCNLCTLSTTVQNVINLALGLSIPIAAGMFAYAGWLYFSNAGSEEKRKQAKSIFKNVLIGFLIALMGWLMVQTILKVLAPGYASWNRFSCTQHRIIDTNPQNVIDSILGKPQAAPVTPISYSNSDTGLQITGAGITCTSDGSCYNASTGSLLNGANSGVSCDPTLGCFDKDGNAVALPSGVTPLNAAGVKQYNDQLAAACSQYGVSDCALAQNIMAAETGGNCPQISGAGAVGCMQLMPTTACGLNGNINGCGSCHSWADNTNGNCAAVVQTLKTDNTLNINTGVQYIAQLQSQFSSCQNTAAAYNGGPNANKSSSTCPGQTYWQCTANAGYLETRNYVAKVCGN